MSTQTSATSAKNNWSKSGPSSIAQDVWDESCKRNPLYWAQRFTATENPHHLQQNLDFRMPLPRKSYFEHLFKCLKENRLILIPKSRDMLTSWSVMIWAAHKAQWHNGFAVVQTMKED